MNGVLAAGCVAAAAVVLWWPSSGRRARRLRVLAELARREGEPSVRAAPPGGAGAARITAAATRLGRPARIATVAVAAVLAMTVGGPVAAVAATSYGTVAVRVLDRHRARRRRAERRARLLDALGVAAADLRAGLPVAHALPAPPAEEAADPTWSRIAAAGAVAERTGAPLADLIERIEADARATDRARAAAAAQLAGARATAWLLAGLPVGGIALGYAIGADPLSVLLHTPVGAACAVGAVALQLAGLAWAKRLSREAEA